MGFQPCPCQLLALDPYLHDSVPQFPVCVSKFPHYRVMGQSELLCGKDSEHSKWSVNSQYGHLEGESFGDPGEYTQGNGPIIVGP